MSLGLGRRDLLRLTVASGIVGIGGCRRRPPGEAPDPVRLAFFTRAELATVSAACERILPRDEDPGAIDLGVPLYLDRALADDGRLHGRDGFRAGLRALDEEAGKRSGTA